MQDPNFYNVTLRNFAAPMSNKPQSVFVPLNDYTATIIGMVRDNVPFNTVLSADLIYIGNVSRCRRPTRLANNNHYQYLDNNNADLSNRGAAAADAVLADRHPVRGHRRGHDHLRRVPRPSSTSAPTARWCASR